MTYKKLSDNIWVVENFLSAPECAALIQKGEAMGFKEATVSLKEGATMLKAVRNNSRVEYNDAKLAAQYFKRALMFLPEHLYENVSLTGLNEKWRFYKYHPGERFKMHMDGRYQGSANEESRLTFMIYLNQDFTGGSTLFKNGEVVQPKTGDLLIFRHEEKHAGNPTETGTKYVLRSDVMYAKYPDEPEFEPGGSMIISPVAFCSKAGELMDVFMANHGFELVRNEYETYFAWYEYKNYSTGIKLNLHFSNFPTDPPNYSVQFQVNGAVLPLSLICFVKCPAYAGHSPLFTGPRFSTLPAEMQLTKLLRTKQEIIQFGGDFLKGAVDIETYLKAKDKFYQNNRTVDERI